MSMSPPEPASPRAAGPNSRGCVACYFSRSASTSVAASTSSPTRWATERHATMWNSIRIRSARPWFTSAVCGFVIC